jgi:hypothetical protein
MPEESLKTFFRFFFEIFPGWFSAGSFIVGLVRIKAGYYKVGLENCEKKSPSMVGLM